MGRRNTSKKWQYAGLGVLAVTSLGAAAYALAPAESPAPTTFTPAPMTTPDEKSEPFLEWPDKGPLEVVFAGDSLTYGLYASEESKGYRPQVVAELEEEGNVEWSRGGQSGNKVETVTDSISFPKSSDLIVLELGTNDVWETDVDVFARQYEDLVAKAEKAAPDAALVCLGVWSNVDGGRNYDPLIKEPCVEAGGKFIPLHPLYEEGSNRGPAGRDTFGGVSDDFHPNDDGYAAIAEKVLEALR